MADFHYAVRAECYVGPDTIFKLPLIMHEIADRVLLIVDPSLVNQSIVKKIQAILDGRGFRIILFDDIAKRPSATAVQEALGLARGARAPLVLGIGGIKCLHIAKAVATLASSDGPVEDWLDGRPPLKPPLPLVLVPTSWRDPFLLSGQLVLSDARSGSAVHLQGPAGLERAVIIDTNLMAGLPAKTAAACILDGIMSAVEGLAARGENFLSDMALREAVMLYVQALDIVMQRPDDPQARELGARAFFLAALGLASSSPGLGTAVSYALSSRWHIPKANVAAVIIPYLLEALIRSRPEKIASLAPAFGEAPLDETASAAADRVVDGVRTRLGMLKIPSRLKDFELGLERLVETAETARRFSFMNFLPRSMTVDDVFDFIKTVF
ncbi:MAG: hypothetical protein A2087_00295 [Spirochaetes bacterium GWD1_61_31]|nr:MAG: hypothetical protein A2Y37_00535 [Spirochaetes bacterium GWB1_60_80]OHD35522.1 MAG: hypothetical protein A2004_01240 [Spirochaetes bacterium GWC1_61_12]OHD38995.1 MAG: hypothetical protein A2087_00295 [Spirochaetes bacterium GWD1_61_31]OHD43494.1 MAG: hypothetical protein A2Y35_14895 [Spirochaetes bacterium GWE1_60_18]OHD60757.1 MAG: hypothetical protein A2Y32_07795 [Spirochaetes bacterium GWF1_60_12]HAW86433.1 hypothetical protein [Spirochaetaceae bacterium]